MVKRQLSRKKLTYNEVKKKEKAAESYTRPDQDQVYYTKQGVIKMFIPKDGKNRIRIIRPFEFEDIGFYGMEVQFHRGIGEKGEDWYGDYICNQLMSKILKQAYPDDEEIKSMEKRCYHCEHQTSELWDSDPELAKTYFPERRIWFFVHDLLSEKPSEVLLWSCPWTLHKEILGRSTKEESSVVIPVDHPDDGVPISFERHGKGVRTRYINVQVFKDPYPLDDDVVDRMIEFKDVLVFASFDEVKAASLNVHISEVDSDQQVDQDQITTEDTQLEDNVEQEEQQQPDPPSCFQKNFGEYYECDAETDEKCEFAKECENPPEPEVKKPRRPSRKPSKPAPAKKAPAKKAPAKNERPDGSSSSDDEKKAAIRKKIKAAQKRAMAND